jgi:hypothetical protein
VGLKVGDEVRCPKSGYSIDMIVHDSGRRMGGERSSSTGTWAVEFDGPSHFLTSRAPTGATLLKRRHLELLGHALVTVPYWEWEGCKGAREREQYLRGKLAHFVQKPSTGGTNSRIRKDRAGRAWIPSDHGEFTEVTMASKLGPKSQRDDRPGGSLPSNFKGRTYVLTMLAKAAGIRSKECLRITRITDTD